MLKSHLNIRTSPELCDLQRFFLSQINIPEQKITPVVLPFYNFVIYAMDMFTAYAKSSLQITFNVFLVDQHLRKYKNSVELYRRFMGFVNSWKKLLTTFLMKNRNERKNVKTFLKLRKILLKNLNQKILMQINLTHEDVITIIHTLQLVSNDQRRVLTKKINEHFISKNAKFLNTAKVNAAVLSDIFLTQINDRQRVEDKLNLSNKLNKLLLKQKDFIEQFQEQSINHKDISFQDQHLHDFGSHKINDFFSKQIKQNINPFADDQQDDKHQKNLVNLEKCMMELSILKEKDMEIDNRFKKLNKK